MLEKDLFVIVISICVLLTYLRVFKNYEEFYNQLSVTSKRYQSSLTKVDTSIKTFTVEFSPHHKSRNYSLFTSSSSDPDFLDLRINVTYIDKICEPVEKVVFLKTHKTGSETVAGILRRYALLNNLSTLLATANVNAYGGHLYYHGTPDKYALVSDRIKMTGYGLPGAHYELIATHMTWNKSFVDSQVPKLFLLKIEMITQT